MIEVRPETPGDRKRIFRIQEAAFGRVNEAELVDALRASVLQVRELTPGVLRGLGGRVRFHSAFAQADTG
jgi:predicted N-acetyltransferase YhbS